MLLLDAFNKDRASLPQPLPNPPPLAPIPVAAPDPRTQEMINEKLKKAEDLGEQGKVDEAQKALEEAEVLKKNDKSKIKKVIKELDEKKGYTKCDLSQSKQGFGLETCVGNLGSEAEIVSCLWEERSECVVASSLAISGGKDLKVLEHLIFSAFGDVEDECEAIQESMAVTVTKMYDYFIGLRLSYVVGYDSH
ncbi:hypothetical protein Ahy_A08g039862 [Arachis hypogaea]|uniref:Uncharacterized protein n=1 Tax=Arachis hypogaea TaxID=3818 RepID=A0A445BXK5_ARAHY|nr:hypothetical protein Ahy_A08g039862 [Arachis hypogaea]